MKKNLKNLLFLGGVLLLLAGITLLPLMEREKSRAETEDRERVAPVQGAFAPNFSLFNLSGEQVELKVVYEQSDLTILNFWATWCGPCQREIPDFNRFAQEYRGRGVAIVAVNLQEKPAQVREFVRKQAMEFPVLLDTEAKVAREYYVTAIPTTFFIDREGRIRLVHRGMLDYDRLVRVAEEFL
ncbi:MAG TPA: TlpA family protein disulfide reductase [Firmicutes bacterium]|nr:TlpA family protein disulfide reductase [Bacillota bacterium]